MLGGWRCARGRTSTRSLADLHANAMAGDGNADADADALANQAGHVLQSATLGQGMNRIFTAAFIIISLQKQQKQFRKLP